LAALLALASVTASLTKLATNAIGSLGLAGVGLLTLSTGVVGLPGTEPTMLFAGFDVYEVEPQVPEAILDLIEQWGWVDRSHRKLAHRGSYTAQVFVSPSTLLRVALKHRVVLPGEPVRARPVLPAMPQVAWERNRIWIWDATHFPRAKRVAYAIVDVVTRYWIGYLLTSEQTSTQAQLLFARALEDQERATT